MKVESSDGNESDQIFSTPSLQHTATGILSNRRPLEGPLVPLCSHALNVDNCTGESAMLITSKREVAKTMLYARFVPGPILDPEASEKPMQKHNSQSNIWEKDCGMSMRLEVAENVKRKSKSKKPQIAKSRCREHQESTGYPVEKDNQKAKSEPEATNFFLDGNTNAQCHEKQTRRSSASKGGLRQKRREALKRKRC